MAYLASQSVAAPTCAPVNLQAAETFRQPKKHTFGKPRAAVGADLDDSLQD